MKRILVISLIVLVFVVGVCVGSTAPTNNVAVTRVPATTIVRPEPIRTTPAVKSTVTNATAAPTAVEAPSISAIYTD